jgi:uncharacterized repeat protein (TIGR01451 family)
MNNWLCIVKDYPCRGVSQRRHQRNSIAFIDQGVEDWEQLVTGVTESVIPVTINSASDGIEQITEVLAHYQDLDGIHLVAHGAPGQLHLGTALLSTTTLERYKHAIQQWTKALSEQASLLIYGCQVAAGESGHHFLQQLNAWVKLPTAASDKKVGSAALGGTWNLENRIGQVQLPIAFSTQTQQQYGAVFAELFTESFRGDEVFGPWIYGIGTGTINPLNPRLTARTGDDGVLPGISVAAGGAVDAVGEGALRLTSNDRRQATFVFYDSLIPSEDGLDIQFDFHIYNGSGADGISFFLIDGSANPTDAGAFGGSLGYAQRNGAAGLVGGYIGVGFDEFGNYSNGSEGRNGGLEDTTGDPAGTRYPDAVAIRGADLPGTANDYAYLAGTDDLKLTNPAWSLDFASQTTRSDANKRRARVLLTPDDPTTVASEARLSVWIDFDNNGFDASEKIIDEFDVAAVNGAIPEFFKFGFASSTGGATNIHEIRNLTIETVNTPSRQADLVVTKTGPANVLANGTIEYTITVTNNGPNASQNVRIADALPTGLTFNSASDGGSFDSTTRSIVWPTIASLANGDSVSFTVTAIAPNTTGTSFRNTAFVNQSTFDPDQTNNRDRFTTNVVDQLPTADLTISKTAPATVQVNQTITYEITITNDGPDDATDVLVTDVLPNGLTFDSASNGGSFNQNTGNVTWTIASLANGASRTFTVTAIAPSRPGSFDNTATVTSTIDDPDLTDNDDTATVDVERSSNVDAADVSIVKRGPDEVGVGETIRYSLIIKNDGPDDATDVQVKDLLPKGLTFSRASDGGRLNNNGNIIWDKIPVLESGESIRYSVVAIAPNRRGNFDNTAVVNASSDDPNTNNNSDTTTVQVTANPSPKEADLVVTKTGPAKADGSDLIRYTITVVNNGAQAAENVKVRDLLPDQFQFEQASGNGDYRANNNSIVWPTIPTLASGEEVSFTVRVFTPDKAGKYDNTATASTTTTESKTNNNRDIATVTIELDERCKPGVRLAGTGGDDRLKGGPDKDVITGKDGDDVLVGLACIDRIFGGAGNDELRGGGDSDTLQGDAGNDKLFGGDGNDDLTGGRDDDQLFGEADDDVLSGNGGADDLDGGDGNDRLSGRQGNDNLFGQKGNDILDGNLGLDVLDGGNGQDLLRGNAASDTLSGGNGEDILSGGQGSDTLRGGNDDDELDGNLGRDTLFGDDGNDRLQGNIGDDVLDGGAGDDIVSGGSGDDEAHGGDGNDSLDGNLGNDTLFGDAGDDKLLGKFGDDTMSGGDGEDTLIGSGGADILRGGNDNDRLLGNAQQDSLFGEAGDDLVVGGLGNDLLVGGDGDDKAIGRSGGDTMNGGDGNDDLNGNLGEDILNGNGGNDILVGGLGADELTGGKGRDRFVYQSVRDRADIITDFDANEDEISLRRLFASPEYAANNPLRRFIRLEERITPSLNNPQFETVVFIDPDGNAGNADFVKLTTLTGVRANSLTADNFVV